MYRHVFSICKFKTDFDCIVLYFTYFYRYFFYLPIQSVSEIRVLILTSERTRQFMKLFSITFCKIRKSIPRFFAPQF
jgi:hypothetical protein